MTINRNERALAFMIASIVGLSILAFIALIIGVAAGVDVGAGIWPVIYVFPGIGLPVGLILIIVLIVLSARRRGREAAAEREAAARTKKNPGPSKK